MIKIHIVSETPFVKQGTGVHTAFADHIKLLKEGNDIQVVVNDEGTGDVFHSHTYGPYYFWKGRKYKGVRVLTVHVIPDSMEGTITNSKLWMPFVNWYLKKVYNYADVCIAISPMVKKALQDLGVKSKVVSILNPIDLQLWKRTKDHRERGRKLLGLADDDFVVLGVGQIQGRKGVEDFIDIGAATPQGKFVWVGGTPMGVLNEGSARIHHKISNAQKNIHFAGLIDLENMPLIYAAADILLFPSFQENCPLAPLEAAACGMPVIFRNIPEYTTLYERPYLKADNTQEFIEITQRLILDPTFYQKALDLSQALLLQFDRNNIRKKMISLYSGLIAKNSLKS